MPEPGRPNGALDLDGFGDTLEEVVQTLRDPSRHMMVPSRSVMVVTKYGSIRTP